MNLQRKTKTRFYVDDSLLGMVILNPYRKQNERSKKIRFTRDNQSVIKKLYNILDDDFKWLFKD